MYNINTNKIKSRIYEKGYNIKEVANKINIHKQTISNWINGRNITNIKKFLELLYILDLNIKDLIEKKGAPKWEQKKGDYKSPIFRK